MNPSLGLPALLLSGLIACSAVVFAAPALLVDGDGDGISDERDECPYSAPGEVVNAVGCGQTGDADGDQVGDVADMCPYTSPGAAVDAEGCAMDDDFDGIANGLDQCPQTLLGERVDVRGCEPGSTVLAKPASEGKLGVAAKPSPVITPVSATVAAISPAVSEAAGAAVGSSGRPGAVGVLEPLAEIGFDRNSAALNPAAQARIQEVVRAAAPRLARNPDMLLRISSRHQTNEKPAVQRQRDEALHEALMAAGIAPTQLSIDTSPKAGRRDATGRWAGLQLWSER